jgi:ribosomal subunit interface protein
MELPLQITFRGMPPSEAVEARVREKAAKLERFHGRITSCHVTIEAPHHHQTKGNLLRVLVDVTVPGGELIANRNGKQNPAHEDVYVALRDAFDAITRQLEDHARQQRESRVGLRQSAGVAPRRED